MLAFEARGSICNEAVVDFGKDFHLSLLKADPLDLQLQRVSCFS